MSQPVGKLAILGLGLIGGSLAAALRARGAVSDVVGWGRRETSLRKGLDAGVIDRFTLQLADAVDGADMVVIATPTLVAEALLGDVLGLVEPGAVVTDVASVKGNLARAAAGQPGGTPANLVLAHPIAGSEMSGVEAADPDLFVAHRVILTPESSTDPRALAQVRAMWEVTGAEVVEMGVDEHDRILAATSHLPHMLAYTLVDLLAQSDRCDEIFRFAAGGFRDFTRIASSDAVMWRDIALANSTLITAMLDAFGSHLAGLRTAVAAGDGDAILALFERARRAREGFVEPGRSNGKRGEE